ncbi:VanZ family protein [Flavobacterium nackdongense]|uniref:VanZ family protein n=1 Tax=Flavobacterium nackdongense TaxID=2547394 RepID=UPI0013FD08F5|nr:VanZ family protein [Flavobacterium nackdongense]
MRKKVFLVAALFWSGVILFFCLENAKDIPQISLPYIDKFVHLVFHFVFTTLWFLYFKKRWNSSNYSNSLILSFGFSLVFGISIELLQQYVTLTRSADVIDVLANTIGASLAIISIILLNSYYRIIDKI